MTDEPKPFDAGDSGSVRSRRKELRRTAVSDEAAIRHMLGTEFQRRIMWDFLGECGLFQAVCYPGQGEMYFAAGRREAALRWLALIPHDLYVQMANEAKERNDG